jgi:hypothetical protein
VLSFGAIIAAKNVLAMKDATTALFNYEIHERPSWFHKKILTLAKVWVANWGLKQFRDLQEEVKPGNINLGLNDCTTSLFAVLYLANEQNNVSMEKLRLSTGHEVFASLSHLELEFEKLKKQQAGIVSDTKYEGK